MHSIKVLDVTLRDGGCVNDFNFGSKYMDQILLAEERAGINCIELGYIDDKNGAESGRTKFISINAANKFIKQKRKDIEYLVMMDYGKYDVSTLPPKSDSGVDGIRVAFHKKDLMGIASIGKTIIEKGYNLYIQPMLTCHYSDEELLQLIKIVNEEISQLKALYIVDSFGEMRANDVIRIFNIYDHNLLSKINLGFHSHNNLQLSYSNAISFILFQTKRNIYIDSSILGMGKGAGNLNTELLLDHLNIYYGKKYELLPLMNIIDSTLNPLKAEYNWGYSIKYYLSSKYHISPSYANYFYDKHSLSITQLSELLDMVDERKKISFDKEYAQNIYLEYKAKNLIDDSSAVEKLKRIIEGRNILLIAPGKNAKIYIANIKKCIQEEDPVIIGVNDSDLVNIDYLFITRMKLLEQFVDSKIKIITLSNITTDVNNVFAILNYSRWVIADGETHDSAGVVSLKLMEFCHPNKVMLAGFDGLSYNLNENYYDETMRYAYSEESVINSNKFYKNFIKNLREKIEIDFITPSVYEE